MVPAKRGDDQTSKRASSPLAKRCEFIFHTIILHFWIFGKFVSVRIDSWQASVTVTPWSNITNLELKTNVSAISDLLKSMGGFFQGLFPLNLQTSQACEHPLLTLLHTLKGLCSGILYQILFKFNCWRNQGEFLFDIIFSDQ